MNRYTTWAIGLAAAVALAPSASFAKGTFKGTYGTEHFKSKKLGVQCAYTRSISMFSVGGAQGNAKRQKYATAGGMGADPSAPGAPFPIVLTEATAGFGSGLTGQGNAFPTWYGGQGAVVVTLTGYKKGKVSGTITGTLAPTLGTGTPIEATATFVGKCLIQ